MKALAAIALLLLLAGAAQAGPQQILEGSAVALATAGEDTQLQGPLGVVDVVGVGSGSVAFHLEGSIRMEVDHETQRAHLVGFETTGSGTDHPAGRVVAVDGAAGRDNRELVVFPILGLASQVVAGPSSVGVANPSDVVVHHVNEVPREPRSVVAEGLRVSGSAIEVRGAFAVAVWEWDFDATLEDGTVAPHWTGVRETPLDGLPSETTPAARDVRRQQAFLFVTDGVLSIPVEGQAVAYLPSATSEVRGGLTLQGVQATMSGPSIAQQVTADRFTVHGDLLLDMGAPADGRVPFAASGEGRSVIEVDGATLQWTGPSGGWPAWATWAGVAALALLAPPAAVAGRRSYLRWESRRLARAETLLDMEAFGEARRAARPLLRSSRLRSEAVVIHIESLLAEGRAAEALPVLEQPRFWTLAPALRDYLAARAHAVLGNLADARAALGRALAAAPDLAVQAAAEPTLRPLIKDTPEGYT